MSADRELLELAARAAGLRIVRWADDGVPLIYFDRLKRWNPLRTHAQAKNLRHLLRLRTGFDDRFAELGPCAYATYPTGAITCNSVMQNIEQAGSKKAALRRAVVLAAVEMAKAAP